MRGARWNPVGSLVVYAATAYEGALLEQLVHAGIGRLPANRVASRISVPEDAQVQVIEAIDDHAWRDDTLTQAMGLEWLEAGDSLVLLVPSAGARPFGQDALLNPGHRDFARVTVVEEAPVSWDPRL